MTKHAPHPAISAVLRKSEFEPYADRDRGSVGLYNATSVSLARVLAIGGLSRLEPSLTSIDVWDPAAGLGFAGHLLVEALRSAGVAVRYRGQDIDEAAVAASRRRFEAVHDAEVAHADTLAHDLFPDFKADLVIVDAPWGVDWQWSASAVEARQSKGEFSFGLPQRTDGTWLFISLAIEKLRPPEQGGGRVAALVNPRALSSSGASAAVRQRIAESGLLESVTRLPDGLAPNTSIPLYLLTFSNKRESVESGKVLIADLQTMFTTEHHRRSIPLEALLELESGLRTRKSGPRNRTIHTQQLVRRDARLSRVTSEGRQLSWRLSSYNDTPIDDELLEARYGLDSDVSLAGVPRETFDLDPSRVFGDDSRELLRALEAKDWPIRRLSALLAKEPTNAPGRNNELGAGRLFVPTGWNGKAATDLSETNSEGRVLEIEIDGDSVHPPFLAAWLNSEQGIASRLHAIDTASSGHHLRVLRSDASSFMRWADELFVPVPDLSIQLALALADERLNSFQASLETRRASIWSSPENADEVVNSVASAFNDSLTTWLDNLPYPIASALWTAESTRPLGEQKRAYLQAWEAIVTFHATVLLSASRSDPGSSSETEAAIRQTLHDQHLGIEKASFGTWVVIAEKTSADLRKALEKGDADDLARVQRAFAGLGRASVERLVSRDVVKKFVELNGKRNRWSGHTGYTPEEELKSQVDSLVSELRELRVLLGDVWSQLLLVRPGSAKRRRDGWVQAAEVAVGTRTPFATREFSVGDQMFDDELYLVRDGSETPLRLGRFVQLREAPSGARFTSYFYNRTEGRSVRMVSYQYGPDGELQDDMETVRTDFGGLIVG